ncbi:hypothetical protein Sme01_74730 [Sphaerisporangium melleum]|uniref:Thioesterase domain-containing protein n=1 Tax=Sphaerisporangium melleum TaxID=321316 RepID=A0A917VWA4_9ACTN|nr:hypothetical protein [Sphaerisporangium melleum]GGL21681.1 hypothetical protein GCM10007964_74520 [Sphaerisporangium melleum]GII74997.1 hypothetical protein Sme01_74730 [Sphaerisporangium melleum]
MNLVTTWMPLSESDSKDLVLCVDFTETGRTEAGFPDLVARMDHDSAFWHVVPPSVAPGSGVDGGAYVRSWLEPLRGSGRTVRAVMGYCVGAVYAAELVAALAELQDEKPELIVFDPEPTSLENIYFQFGNVFTILSSILTEEDIAGTREVMDRLIRQEDMTVERYASELYAVFREVGHNAFERAGLDQEYGEEMWETFSRFLSFLSYADQLDPWDGWLRATAVSSSTPHNGLNRLRTDDPPRRGDIVAHELSFEEDHQELLRSEEVARAVTKLLEK